MNGIGRCIHVFVSGRVQGVGFRYATCEQARRLGLDGWVRNLPDGRVEALIAGPADAVGAMQAWLAHGPRWARVDELLIEDSSDTPDQDGFHIR